MPITDAVVLMAACSKSHLRFGTRVSRVDNDGWEITWAFRVSELRASREGYSEQRIRGRFSMSKDYPGCPYCNVMSLFQCRCGALACHDGSDSAVCPGCGERVRISGQLNEIGARDDG